MNKIKDGGAAFPTLDGGLAGLHLREHGMTLRDYFAAKAMQVTLSMNNDYPDENWRIGIAMDAYLMADAMLAVRDVENV